MNRIRIKMSFWIVMIFMVFTGYGVLYAEGIIFAFIHELCHIGAAACFGLDIEKIYIMPVGCKGVIKNFYSINCMKRCIVLLSGPLFNLFMAFFSYFMNWENIMYVNTALFLCNIMPAVPFDGGIIIKNITGEWLGAIKGIRISSYLTRMSAVFIIAVGILQIVLFCFNISILCLGIYILRESRKEQISEIYNFYGIIYDKRNKEHIYKVREFVLNNSSNIAKCLKLINIDDFNIINICENGKLCRKVAEWQIFDEIMRNS